MTFGLSNRLTAMTHYRMTSTLLAFNCQDHDPLTNISLTRPFSGPALIMADGTGDGSATILVKKATSTVETFNVGGDYEPATGTRAYSEGETIYIQYQVGGDPPDLDVVIGQQSMEGRELGQLYATGQTVMASGLARDTGQQDEAGVRRTDANLYTLNIPPIHGRHLDLLAGDWLVDGEGNYYVVTDVIPNPSGSLTVSLTLSPAP